MPPTTFKIEDVMQDALEVQSTTEFESVFLTVTAFDPRGNDEVVLQFDEPDDIRRIISALQHAIGDDKDKADDNESHVGLGRALNGDVQGLPVDVSIKAIATIAHQDDLPVWSSPEVIAAVHVDYDYPVAIAAGGFIKAEQAFSLGEWLIRQAAAAVTH